VLSLRDTQRALSAALFGASPGSLESLVREDGIAAANRVAIYANNTRIGFELALAATYPVIQRLAGADWFRQHARGYQQCCPSRRGDLQYVGDRYADYLQSALGGSPYEYFVDVARLEWACQEALVARDDCALDPQSLADVAAEDHERIVLVPRACLRLLESRYPLLQIWQANQTDDHASRSSISLDDGPVRLAILRRAQHIEMRALSPEPFELLQRLKSGVALGAVAEAAAKSGLHCNFAAALRELFSMQVFASYHLCADRGPEPRLIDTVSRS
jgi:hypothetical protein